MKEILELPNYRIKCIITKEEGCHYSYTFVGDLIFKINFFLLKIAHLNEIKNIQMGLYEKITTINSTSSPICKKFFFTKKNRNIFLKKKKNSSKSC